MSRRLWTAELWAQFEVKAQPASEARGLYTAPPQVVKPSLCKRMPPRSPLPADGAGCTLAHVKHAAAILPICALAVLAVVSGCGTPLTPTVVATVHRTVTFAVTDSLGAPASSVEVSVSTPDSAGTAELVTLTTDAAGHCALVLRQGSGFVHAAGPTNMVAGSSVRVPGVERTAADTLLVNLRLGTASRVSGIVTLQTRNEHSGTFVAVNGVNTFVMTDSAGAYSVGGLPQGHWTVAFAHLGYAAAFTSIDIVQPGSHVTVPPVHLSVMTREP